jgi:hypothetical protein
MKSVSDLVPTSKHDLQRAHAAISAGYPAVEPILGELIEWLQDYNWPVARVLAPFLASLGSTLVPHIWNVMRSNDEIWKYWVITLLIRALPHDHAVQFRSELLRISSAPSPSEKSEELDQIAFEVLNYFGWKDAVSE